MRWIILMLLLIVILYVGYYSMLKIRNKAATNQIIKLSLKGKTISKVDKMMCSFCRKKEKKLSFYSDERGRVVGVCSRCRPQAERRALMRL